MVVQFVNDDLHKIIIDDNHHLGMEGEGARTKYVMYVASNCIFKLLLIGYYIMIIVVIAVVVVWYISNKKMIKVRNKNNKWTRVSFV